MPRIKVSILVAMLVLLLSGLLVWVGILVRDSCMTVGYHFHRGVVYTVQVDSAGTSLMYEMERKDALKSVKVISEDSILLNTKR